MVEVVFRRVSRIGHKVVVLEFRMACETIGDAFYLMAMRHRRKVRQSVVSQEGKVFLSEEVAEAYIHVVVKIEGLDVNLLATGEGRSRGGPIDRAIIHMELLVMV